MILAIDSSTAWCGVGIYSPASDSCIAERLWMCGINHGAELLPAINDLFAASGTGRESIELVAVARGPGTFNGVRVALATAKGISLALACPIVGVNTLEVHASAFAARGTMVRALLPATRGQVATAQWRAFPDLGRVHDDELSTLEEVVSATVDRTLFVGEAPADWLDELARHQTLIEVIPAELTRRQPATLGRLAWKRASRRDWDDLDAIEPMYLRPPAITIRT